MRLNQNNKTSNHEWMFLFWELYLLDYADYFDVNTLKNTLLIEGLAFTVAMNLSPILITSCSLFPANSSLIIFGLSSCMTFTQLLNNAQTFSLTLQSCGMVSVFGLVLLVECDLNICGPQESQLIIYNNDSLKSSAMRCYFFITIHNLDMMRTYPCLFRLIYPID